MSKEEEVPLFKVFMAPRAELEKPVADVLQSGYVTQGKKVEEFEEHLRHFLGTVRFAKFILIWSLRCELIMRSSQRALTCWYCPEG